jgi:putative transposase
VPQAWFSDASYYEWKAKFGDMDVSYAKSLDALEAENSKPKRGGKQFASEDRTTIL